jgi:hypothetical protein
MTAQEKKNEAQRVWRAKKKAEQLAAQNSQPASTEDVDAAVLAKRAYQREYYAKRRAAKNGNGHAKVNGKNGHAVEVWKPGKGSISVPSILQAHGHAPRSSSHSALVERALGLIEAGLVLVSEELRRK